MKSFRASWLAIPTFGCLAACASTASEPRAIEVGSISYEVTSVGPFCGRCETVKFTIAPSGRTSVERGHWAGSYRSWRIERSRLQVSPDRYAALRDSLGGYRPSGTLQRNSSTNCATFTEDLPEVLVTWHAADHHDQLRFGFGCEKDQTAMMREALRNAPSFVGVRGVL